MHSECLGRYVAHGHEHTGGAFQRQGSVALEPSGAVGPGARLPGLKSCLCCLSRQYNFSVPLFVIYTMGIFNVSYGCQEFK